MLTLALDGQDIAFAQCICPLPEVRLDHRAITASGSPIFPVGASLSRREPSVTEAIVLADAAKVLPGGGEMPSFCHDRSIVSVKRSYSLHSGQIPYDKMIEFLRAEGVVLTAMVPGFVDANSGRKWQFDGIFLR